MTENARSRKVVGIVLAGGYGTRLFGPAGGSKGLFIVDGRPLIDYSLSAIRQAGVDDIAIVTREADSSLRSKYPNYLHLSDQGTGTLQAVLEATTYAVKARADAIISSCDLVCAPAAAGALLESSLKNPEWLACFGVTTIANDQNPIWIHSAGSGQITDYGKGIQPTDRAFASIRFAKLGFSRLVVSIANTLSADINTDTKLMRHLILSEHLIVGSVDIGDAIDVDDAADVKTAERIVQSSKSI